jgi:hypothetical protein
MRDRALRASFAGMGWPIIGMTIRAFANAALYIRYDKLANSLKALATLDAPRRAS